MTALRAQSTPHTRPAPPDLRRTTRLFAALVLPIGPALIAVLRYVMPYNTTDDEKAIVRGVAAHQATQSAVVWLGFAGVLTLVPAVLWVARLTRRQAPRLTAVALLLLVPGYTALAFLVASDAAVLFAVRHHLPVATAGDMYSSLHPIVSVAGGAFVLGHVIGTVLLGVALLRTRVVPRWAAVATIAAQPLHFIAAIIVSSHALDLAGWGLNAIGFAAVSVAILRLRDDDWELAPRAAG
jgi:bacteriorhodopsin